MGLRLFVFLRLLPLGKKRQAMRLCKSLAARASPGDMENRMDRRLHVWRNGEHKWIGACAASPGDKRRREWGSPGEEEDHAQYMTDDDQSEAVLRVLGAQMPALLFKLA